MKFVCQQSSIEDLTEMSKSRKHSILIEGTCGCGKTYLARMYANMLNVRDFQLVEPTVASLRDAIDSCSLIDNEIVVCIENLDLGVSEASSVLLKFLEEPSDRVYIIVTCRNMNRVPPTIISRSSVLTVNPPTLSDIEEYVSNKYSNLEEHSEVKDILRKCVRNFIDADEILNLSEEKLHYIINLKDFNVNGDCISNSVWKFSHFEDNTLTPLEIVIRYLSNIIDSTEIIKSGIDCIRNINQKNVSRNAALTKFVLDVKYLER